MQVHTISLKTDADAKRNLTEIFTFLPIPIGSSGTSDRQSNTPNQQRGQEEVQPVTHVNCPEFTSMKVPYQTSFVEFIRWALSLPTKKEKKNMIFILFILMYSIYISLWHILTRGSNFLARWFFGKQKQLEADMCTPDCPQWKIDQCLQDNN